MDNINTSTQPVLTPINIIEHPKGSIYHGLKSTDSEFMGFGEAYCSTINKNEIKAWKQHQKMWCNLIVPIGEVKFILIDSQNKTYEYTLSKSNYQRLTIPPSIWFGFQGLAENNLIINIASIPHDPTEVHRKDINELPYNWED